MAQVKKAKSKKAKSVKRNETPPIKFTWLRKEVSKEEFDKAAEEVRLANRNDQISARNFGWKLIKLRQCMYHGDFTKWLRSNSIDQNRASYCMRVAEGKTKKKATPKDDPLQENIQRQLGQMYKLASKRMLTPDAMSVHAMEVVHSICARAGKMQGWPVHNPKDAKIAPLLTALKESLDNYLAALFAEHQTARAAEAGSSGS
jgi:hypothetical protein